MAHSVTEAIVARVSRSLDRGRAGATVFATETPLLVEGAKPKAASRFRHFGAFSSVKEGGWHIRV